MTTQISTVNGVPCLVDSGAPLVPISSVSGAGGSMIAGLAAYVANAVGVVERRKVYVDSARGNDSTGALGRVDKPYATIAAASTAALTAGGVWIVEILPGAYTDTGLLPGDSDATIIYFYWPGTTHTITGSGHLFNWTGDHTGKILYVLGYCRFLASGTSVTGTIFQTSYSTSKCLRFHIECEEIQNFNGRSTGMVDLRFNSVGDNGSLFKAQYSFDSNSSGNFYFRIDSKVVYIDAPFCRDFAVDGTARFIMNCDYCEHFYNAFNSFSTGSANIFARYRIKATSQPAIINRRGELVVMSQKYEVTDGNGPILQIPSNADTASGGCQTTFVGGFFRQWSGGSAYPIDFDAANALFKVRFMNCGPIIVENAATECIHADSAQTIEAYGSFVSNKGKSANITVRGTALTVDNTIWTGF